MSRVSQTFKRLKNEKRKAFIAFLTAGYPDLKTTGEFVSAFADAGVDIIELGVPFSDPMADGPVIQESSQEALKKGVTLKKIISLVKEIRSKTQIPICLMSYYNPIFCFGQEKFMKLAAVCGVDGIIIPDLPPDEADTFIKAGRKNKIDTVFFLSPTSSKERVKIVSKASTGFIYYVSIAGVTGERKVLSKDISSHVNLIKQQTDKPVCVGFGISDNKQVAEIYKFADGVIVGSAIVKKIKESINRKGLVAHVTAYVASLKNAKKRV